MDSQEVEIKKRGRPRQQAKPRFGEVRHTGAKRYLVRVWIDDKNETLDIEVIVSHKIFPTKTAIQNLGAAKFARLVEEAKKAAMKKEIEQ